MNSGGYNTCTSPFTPDVEALGTYELKIRAVDGSGTDPTPLVKTFELAPFGTVTKTGDQVFFSVDNAYRALELTVGRVESDDVAFNGPRIAHGSGCAPHVTSTAWTVCPADSSTQVNVEGTEGDDSFLSSDLIASAKFTGGAGNDEFHGSGPDDVYVGGQGDDEFRGTWWRPALVSYEDRTEPVSVDLTGVELSGAFLEGDTIWSGIDGAIGGAGDDFIKGNPNDNEIAGGDGSDEIDGGAGADQINGGDGADLITGGAGADEISTSPGDDEVRANEDGAEDSIDCGDGSDVAFADVFDEVDSSCEKVLITADTEIDSGPSEGSTTSDATPDFTFSGWGLTDFECRVDSEEFAPCASPFTTPTLTAGTTHTFEVRAVADGGPDPVPATRSFVVAGHLSASVGSGTLSVEADSGQDNEVVFGLAGSSILVYSPHGSVSAGSGCSAISIYVLCPVSGFSAVEVAVGDGDDIVTAANLTTALTTEVLGGAGDDHLTANASAVRLVGGDGSDTFTGGTGSEVVDYSDRTADLSLSSDGLANDGEDQEDDNIGASIDSVKGGSGDDTIQGGEGAENLDGGAGADWIAGGPGVDVLVGAAGDDALVTYGDGENDTAGCGADADTAWTDIGDSPSGCETLNPTSAVSFDDGPSEDETVDSPYSRFTFSSNARAKLFECQLDAGDWFSCESPVDTPFLENGPHQFSVRVAPVAGVDVPVTPATRNFAVDSTADSPSLLDLDPGVESRYDIKLDDRSALQVNFATGELSYGHRDVAAVPGNFDSALDRFWTSADSRTLDTGIGDGWRMSFGPDLRLQLDDETGAPVSVALPDGSKISFFDDGDGGFDTTEGFGGSLSFVDDEYRLERWNNGDALIFDSSGALEAFENAAGDRLDVAQAPGILGPDTFGSLSLDEQPAIEVEHGLDGRIAAVESGEVPSGTYAYDGALLSETDAEDGLSEYGYTGTGELNEIALPTGDVVSIDYSSGKVVSVAVDHPSAADETYEFEYGVNRTTVTEPDETTHDLNWPVTGGAGAADPGEQIVEQDEMAESLDISTSEAADRLAIQDRTRGLQEALTERIGGALLSFGYDQDDDGMATAVVRSSAAESLAEDTIEDLGLAGSAQVVTSSLTAGRLRSARDALGDALSTLLNSHEIQLGLDDLHMRVVLTRTSDLDSGELDAIDNAIALVAPVPVEVLAEDVSVLTTAEVRKVRIGACRRFNFNVFLEDFSNGDQGLACERPLRGGMSIYHPESAESDQTLCTAGFSAKHDDTNLLTTAAHCIKDTKLEKWEAPFARGFVQLKSWTIGRPYRRVARSYAGDAAAFVPERAAPWGNELRPAISPIIHGSPKSAYPIVSRAKPTIGRLVCSAGSRGQMRCGTIKQLEVVFEWTPYLPEKGDALFKYGACGVENGDSGAPLVSRGAAIGSLSQKNYAPFLPSSWECGAYAMPITGRTQHTLESELDVKVMTTRNSGVEVGPAQAPRITEIPAAVEEPGWNVPGGANVPRFTVRTFGRPARVEIRLALFPGPPNSTVPAYATTTFRIPATGKPVTFRADRGGCITQNTWGSITVETLAGSRTSDDVAVYENCPPPT